MIRDSNREKSPTF